MRLTVWTTTAVILCVAVPARAQDKKVDGNIGFGYSAVVGEARDSTGDAGLFEAGVTFNATPSLGIQANYAYTGLGKEKTVTLNVGNTPGGGGVLTPQQFSADGHMHEATFNVVWKAATTGRASPFALVGPGVFHRTVNITTPATGFTTICDPYWYVCYPVAVSVDQIIGSRSSTDFGMNFGGGVSFKIGETASVYFEVRYAYIWGPTFDVPAVGSTPARTVTANAQTVPFVFGFRF